MQASAERRAGDTGLKLWCSALKSVGRSRDPVGTTMDSPNIILVYSDYKSPYAFLAKDLIYELEDQFDVHLEWLPYTLDIPSYLGNARLDERGEVIESNGMPISGAECATRTWIAGDKPESA